MNGIHVLLPSKAAELRIATWLLEQGWEVFVPVVDIRETDFVVRPPNDERFIGIQVKSANVGSLNEGQLQNHWGQQPASFDYLIFIEGRRERGVIIPKQFFTARGKTLFVFARDRQGYARGQVRNFLAPFAFDLSKLGDAARAKAFCQRLSTIHFRPPALPAKPKKKR